MRNIELKAILADRAAALAACERIQARAQGDIHQIDTYFIVPNGRLKLRVATPGRTELVYYHRPDIAGAKGCDYLLEPVAPTAGALLGSALGVLATVEKTRTLYLWDNVRIHLDLVTGLGSFIEFEAVIAAGTEEEDGFKKLTYLSDIFNISENDHLKYSYLDMMLDQT